MELINVYIQEVTRRLPEKSREDIALELKSTILDMLPENFSKNDVHQALEKLGNPAVLAARYNERPMYLIGPKYYDLYMSILKIVIPIIAVLTFIVFFINQLNFLYDSDMSFFEATAIVLGECIW